MAKVLRLATTILNLKPLLTASFVDLQPTNPASQTVEIQPDAHHISTPAIPPMTSFVHKVPVTSKEIMQKSAQAQKASFSGKGKRKAAGQNSKEPSALPAVETLSTSSTKSSGPPSSSPASVPLHSLPTPPGTSPSYAPYGYPSYPYYPYYMPPYAIPNATYGYPPPPPGTSKPGQPLGFPPPPQGYPPIPYGYPPPPPGMYGYPPPPLSGYQYMPQRYPPLNYSQTTGQQPYSGTPLSSSPPPYPYYMPIALPASASTNTIQRSTATPEPKLKNPISEVNTKFSHYQHAESSSDSAATSDVSGPNMPQVFSLTFE